MYGRRRNYAKRYAKRDFKRRYAIAKAPRPYRSLYDADVFIKCEHIVTNTSTAGNVFYN